MKSMSDYVRILAFDQRTLQLVEALASIVADYIEIVGGGRAVLKPGWKRLPGWIEVPTSDLCSLRTSELVDLRASEKWISESLQAGRLYGPRTILWPCRKVLRSWSNELARRFDSLVVKLYDLRGIDSACGLEKKKGIDFRLRIWYNALRFGRESRKRNFRKAEKRNDL